MVNQLDNKMALPLFARIGEQKAVIQTILREEERDA